MRTLLSALTQLVTLSFEPFLLGLGLRAFAIRLYMPWVSLALLLLLSVLV